MNILFITLENILSVNSRSTYTDVLRLFAKNGYNEYIASPDENASQSTVIDDRIDGVSGTVKILKFATGKIKKAGLIRKGINMFALDYILAKEIKKHYKGVSFDIIMYATPPITVANTVAHLKKKNHAKTYLLLKDIFPQNAVDLHMFSKCSPIYWYFRRKEQKLYRISDSIGCMSQANVDYLLKHNRYIDKTKVHISPNTTEVMPYERDEQNINALKEKYGIPKDKILYMYGGNMGKPQGIPFLIECLKNNINRDDVHFLICGKGTEYGKLQAFADEYKPKNLTLINGLPKAEYEEFASIADVGLIFLDNRFTIPNFPSRMLSYMQKKTPVFACTDPSTDIGKVITEGKFGWWCQSDNAQNFTKIIDTISIDDIRLYGEKAYDYLKNNYDVSVSYDIITKHIKGEL